ncbi:tryptophan-rich sensory protein [Candidatus Gottesmanbacteria bacterium]|nr:tryptophan-rich sensory protein [Candidatus Gottesmanbacteria bacterium]
MKNLYKLIISVVGCEIVGIASTPFTVAAISTWYVFLVKPFFSPPNWVFGPVWTLLYFLMGVAFYLIWRQGWKKKKVKTAGWYFLVQLSLNFLWSLSFFGLKSPLLGLMNIVVLLGLIILTMRKFYPLSKVAFFLLVPYLLWVGFATLLNASFVVLN